MPFVLTRVVKIKVTDPDGRTKYDFIHHSLLLDGNKTQFKNIQKAYEAYEESSRTGKTDIDAKEKEFYKAINKIPKLDKHITIGNYTEFRIKEIFNQNQADKIHTELQQEFSDESQNILAFDPNSVFPPISTRRFLAGTRLVAVQPQNDLIESKADGAILEQLTTPRPAL